MTKQVDWLSHRPAAADAPPIRGRRVLLWVGLVWTLCVAGALWWLLHGNAGPSVWLVQEPVPDQVGLNDRLHTIFKTDLGLARVYPWILFGPYVALMVWFFPLERGRLRWSLPLNLAACVAFVVASNALEARTRLAFSNVMVVHAVRAEGGQTNRLELRVSGAGLGYRAQEQVAVGLANSTTNITTAMGGGLVAASSSGELSNLLTRLPRGWPGPPPSASWLSLNWWTTLLNLIAYAAVAGLAHAVHFYRRFREREHRALFLESNLATARLQALRAQLQPHFLFNSLNAIAALLRRDPRLAEATLLALSELLRLALSQSERQEVPLREELKFTQRYLEIQQTRFGNKLRVEEAIEPAALDCLVPTLVLQPLVENAIRHGIEPTDEAGLVRLTAHRQDGRLVLSVEDDGVGLKAAGTGAGMANGIDRANPVPELAPALTPVEQSPETNGTGIGLSNLRARLETLYGAAQKLELLPRAERGVAVRVEIPWHVGAAGEAVAKAEG